MMINLTWVSPTAGPAHLGESHPPPHRQLCWLGLEKEGIFSEGKKLVLEMQAGRCPPESLETECHEW